jgi:hypothetical protein
VAGAPVVSFLGPGGSRLALPKRPIADVPGARPIQRVLAEWREAERRLIQAEAGSDAKCDAEADAERLRGEHQRAAA